MNIETVFTFKDTAVVHNYPRRSSTTSTSYHEDHEYRYSCPVNDKHVLAQHQYARYLVQCVRNAVSKQPRYFEYEN